jgi:hypothetical protein
VRKGPRLVQCFCLTAPVTVVPEYAEPRFQHPGRSQVIPNVVPLCAPEH